MNGNKTVLLMILAGSVLQGSGSITGIVVDQTDGVIPNAVITLRSGKVELHGRPNSRGEFAFLDLMPGTYSIEITHPGFRKFTKDVIPVSDGPVNLGKATLTIGFVPPCDAKPAPQTRTVPGAAGIEGRISMTHGVSLPDVVIRIGSQESGDWFTTHADSHGNFEFTKVPPGSYYLTWYTANRMEVSFYGVALLAGKKTQIVKPLNLPPCPKTGCFGMLCL
jgi:hypothetical protein